MAVLLGRGSRPSGSNVMGSGIDEPAYVSRVRPRRRVSPLHIVMVTVMVATAVIKGTSSH